jgi:hypothetical protein
MVPAIDCSGIELTMTPQRASLHVAPVFGEPARFAAAAAPVWSERDSRRYHLSENQATASEKPQESE